MFGKVKSKPIMSAGFLLVIVSLVAAGAFTLSHTPSSEASSVIVQDYLDAEKTILYIGNVDDTGAPFAVVMYDSSNPEALRHYAEASRVRGQELIDAGVTELYVWVTFRRPIEVNAFEALAKQTGLDAKRYSLRALGRKGDRVGIIGSPAGGKVVPPDQLDSAMKGIQAHESNQAQLKGVFEVMGVISADGYQKLIRDPRAFLIDVTGSLVYRNPNFTK